MATESPLQVLLPHTFTPEAVQPPDTPTPPQTPRAVADDIDITEIMVDTGSGRFPQWIELTSSAAGKVTLDDWSMVIDNAIDTGVLGEWQCHHSGSQRCDA